MATKNDGLFDPSEQETEELLPKNETEQEDFNDDTLADPEGAEAREPQNRGTLYPTWIYRDYRVNGNDELEPNPSAIENIMNVFDFHVGHDIPESKGGTLDLENLKPICSRCNQSMSDNYTIQEWIQLTKEKEKKKCNFFGLFSC